MATSSGFTKKASGPGSALPTVPGTTASAKTQQLLTSVGVPGLDELIGGLGVPVGTVLVLENSAGIRSERERSILAGEAAHRVDYAEVLLNRFLSEGSKHGHAAFVARCRRSVVAAGAGRSGKDADDVDEEDESLVDSAGAISVHDDDLKIAWRYRDVQKSRGSSGVDSDKEETLPAKTASLHWRWAPPPLLGSGCPYRALFRDLSDKVTREKAFAPRGGTNVVRVAVSGADSILMCGSSPDDGFVLFLYALRSLARKHLAVVALSVAAAEDHDEETGEHQGGPWPNADGRRRACLDLADFVIRTTPLPPGSVLRRTHHGVLSFCKVPTLRCLASPLGRRVGEQYLFKATKTKFALEKYRLPPELSRTGGTGSGSSSLPPSPATVALDF